jgi:ribosome modulation factor
MAEPTPNQSNGLNQPTNPYDNSVRPELHQAYREGWRARTERQAHEQNPYAVDEQPRRRRAWTNGWQAAHLRALQQAEA